MALQLTTEAPSGIEVTDAYWTAVEVLINREQRRLWIVLHAYKDAQAWADRKGNVGRKTIEILGDEFDTLLAAYPTAYAAVAGIVYGLATQDPAFEGATNV